MQTASIIYKKYTWNEDTKHFIKLKSVIRVLKVINIKIVMVELIVETLGKNYFCFSYTAFAKM